MAVDDLRRKLVLAVASVSAVFSAGSVELGAGWQGNFSGSFDVLSGYVLYGGRQNDEPCCWTFLNADIGRDALGFFGASLVQNTDFTCRRGEAMRRMNEWDWGVYYRNGIDIAEGWRLQGDINHIWYVYHGVRPGYRKAYATVMEAVARVSLENPYIVPYYMLAYDHRVSKGTYMEGGLRRSFSLPWDLTFTPDLTVGGANRRYLPCIYPAHEDQKSCVSYAQLAGKVRYAVNERFGIHGMIAWSSILDDNLRSAIDRSDSCFANDFVWGYIGVDFAF